MFGGLSRHLPHAVATAAGWLVSWFLGLPQPNSPAEPYNEPRLTRPLRCLLAFTATSSAAEHGVEGRAAQGGTLHRQRDGVQAGEPQRKRADQSKSPARNVCDLFTRNRYRKRTVEGWRKLFEIDFRNAVSMSVRGQT